MDKVEQFWAGRTLIRWIATQWCNYACTYCDQAHSRKQIYLGSPGHWADNRPVDDWIAAFNRIPNLSLLITGGEPFVDRKNFQPLLEQLDCTVKVNTNGAWDFVSWRPPKSVAAIMLSYHPEHATEAEFFETLLGLKNAGWPVKVVNLVYFENGVDVDRFAETCDNHGTTLSLLPNHGKLTQYSPHGLTMLKRYIPPLDWPVRTGTPPKGRPCLYPSVAYKVNPDGSAETGCHSERKGSVFAGLPERFSGYTACPHNVCFCAEKYSFSLGVNVGPLPLLQYAERVQQHRLELKQVAAPQLR